MATSGNGTDWFGYRVSLSGNVAVVGAYRTGVDHGAAYVFERSHDGWNEQVKLIPGDRDAEDCFGYDVAASGSCVLVGSYSDNDLDRGAGSAYFVSPPSLDCFDPLRISTSTEQGAPGSSGSSCGLGFEACLLACLVLFRRRSTIRGVSPASSDEAALAV